MKDDSLRTQLVKLLTGEQAHMRFEEAVADFPEKYYNTKPPHVSYTPWHLLEHIHITQKDILDFILVDGYKEKKWPADYWPKKTEKADKKKWGTSIKRFIADTKALQKIGRGPETRYSGASAVGRAVYYISRNCCCRQSQLLSHRRVCSTSRSHANMAKK